MTKLTKEEKIRLKELSQELKTQDNRATEPLVFFEIQDVESFSCNSDIDNPDFYYYNYEGCDEPFKGDDIDEIMDELRDYFKDDEEELRELESLNLDYYDSELTPFCYRYVTKGIFFTEKGAKKHLKENNYHYSDKVRIYATTSWRNPDAKLIYKLLTSF